VCCSVYCSVCCSEELLRDKGGIQIVEVGVVLLQCV